MRWIESDIETFWAMKREGASLIEIADRLGRDYKAVQNLQYNLNKKRKIMEDKPMTEETKTTTVPEPLPVPAPELPKIDAAAQSALAMIAAQGLVFKSMNLFMDGESATITMAFLPREK